MTTSLNSPSQRTVHFDLPSRALNNVLLEFALQADVDIVFSHAMVKHQTSSPIVGRYSPRQALSLILSKTELTFRYIEASNTIIIEQSLLQLDDNSRNTIAIEPAAINLTEELLITGNRYPFRYTTITESSQVHGGLSNFDTARFFNVLPQQILIDQKPQDVSSALKNISSLSPADGLAGSNDDFYIRGFPRNAIYVDQFRWGAQASTKVSLAGIERIEIVKGPSTLDFGQAEPGGVVNVVRKIPENEQTLVLETSYESGDAKRYVLDSTGPLLATDKFLYRLIYENFTQEEDREFSDITREYISPKLRWQPSNDIFIDLSYEYYTSSYVRDQQSILLVPSDFGQLDLLALDVPLRQAQPHVESKNTLSSVAFTYFFLPSWHLSVSYFDQHEERSGVRVNLDSLLSTTAFFTSDDASPQDFVLISVGGISIPIFVSESSIRNGDNSDFIQAELNSIYHEAGVYDAQLYRVVIEGSGNLFSLPHHITIGSDLRNETSETLITIENREDIATIDVSDINNIDVVLNEGAGDGTLTSRKHILDYLDFGIFLQDNIEINEDIVLSTGFRYTHTEGTSYASAFVQEIDLPKYNELSSQLGIVYKTNEDTSLYINYSEAMKPNYVIDDSNSVIDTPELSNQKELGLKSLTFDGKLLISTALFQIEKENIVDITFQSGLRQASSRAAQEAKGIDFDFTYQVNNQIDILGSFSFLDNEITRGKNTGNQPALVSDNTASLFFNYRFDTSFLKNLNTNLGVYYIGDRFANDENTDILDKFATVDAGIWYEVAIGSSTLKCQLNVKNITDEVYIASSEGQFRDNLGQRRNVQGSVTLTF